MTSEIRPIAQEEADAFLRADSRAFGHHASAEAIQRERSVLEVERTLAAFDGSQIVGGAAALSFEMSVPGGRLRTGGVGWVTAQPTHRRRGFMTQLIKQLLEDIHARDEPLAALWASESIIYSRFGYGIATVRERWSIQRQHTAFAHGPKPSGQVALLEPGEAQREFPEVYARALAQRPGSIPRGDAWWRYRLWDLEESRRGATALFHAGYRRDGRLDGYLLYRIDHARQTLRVVELVADSDEAHAALWSFCFGVDLISRTEAFNRPPDDPLCWMLADPRRLERSLSDGLWLRLVDVGAALAGRLYAREGRIVFDVIDSLCPWNQSRLQLEGGPDGAECVPTKAEPDLSLAAADLAAAYLGAVRFSTLSRAGRVRARTPDALRRADAMFATSPQAWCIHVF